MEDQAIIELYWQRDEAAITETDLKYGRFCHTIAYNILAVREDAEECVNDTWHKAWNAIPPERPKAFRVWLGRIVRNLSLDRWHRNHAQKRDCSMEQMLSELEDCIPGASTVEQSIEAGELSKLISDWLDTLPEWERTVFIRRYWYGETVNSLAKQCHMSPGKMAQRMFRLRTALKTYLEKEEVAL